MNNDSDIFTVNVSVIATDRRTDTGRRSRVFSSVMKAPLNSPVDTHEAWAPSLHTIISSLVMAVFYPTVSTL